MSFVRSVQEPDPAFFDHVSFYKGQLFDRPLNYLIDQCNKLCSLFPCLLLVLLMPPINACCVCMVLRRSARVVESGSCWRNFQGTRLVGIVEAPHLHQFQQLRFDWIELLSFLSSITSILEVLLCHWSSDFRSLLSAALDFQSLRLLSLLDRKSVG